MKHLKHVVILFALCAVPVASFASGVLVDVKGKVTVAAPGKKNVAAKIGAELPDGTKVSVPAGGAASVMLQDGAIQEVGAGQKYTIGGAQQVQGKRTMIQGIALAMNEVAASGTSPTVHGMVKMTQPGVKQPKPSLVGIGAMGPQGTYPVETTIELTPEITFTWSQRIRFDFPDPVIVVENDSKEQIAVKKIVPASGRLTIKTSEIKLAPGDKYSWFFASNVQGKAMGKSRRFNFVVLSGQEQARLNNDKTKVQAMDISEDGKKFLIAQLYYRSRMLHAMVKELLPLWQKNRTDTIKRLLFFAYAKMGQPEEAKKYQ